MELDRDGVALQSYFRRHLVRGRPQRHLSMRQGHDYVRDASCPLPLPALISDSSSATLAMSQDSALAEQPQLADCRSGLMHQQVDALKEPVVAWQPELEAAMQVRHLEGAACVDFAAGGGGWGEHSCSQPVRELIEEQELAAAAA